MANQISAVPDTTVSQLKNLTRTGPLRPQQELLRARLSVPDSLISGQLGLAALFAPAGFGKSTLMAAWRDEFEAAGLICCWLSIDGKHRDPKTLFQALLAALHQQVPELSFERTELNLRSATSYLIEPLLASLMDELIASEKRIVLFLDNVEALSGSMASRTLSMLVDHRPDNLCLVLGGRESHPRMLSNYRLAGKIVEFKTSDLSFNSEEIRTLFHDHFKIDINEESLSQLALKTEGWPAALSLYALGNSSGNNTAASLDDFANASNELAAYLGNVLFDGLDSITQEVLLRASVPNHFSIGLLEQLIPFLEPTLALERITQSNLFVQKTAAGSYGYRFHSLCADFMRRRLQESNPQLYRELLGITGDWCWDNNQPYDAVNYAKDAKDWDLMAQRVSELAGPLVQGTGEFDTYLEWLRDLPEATMKSHPQLFLFQAWALGLSREGTQAEFALSRLESLLPDLDEDTAGRYRRKIEVYHFLIEAFKDQGQLLLAEMQSWPARHPEHPPMEAALRAAAMSSAARNANQLDLALSSIDEAESIFRQEESDYLVCWAHNVRLTTLIKSGNFVDARIRGNNGLKMICDSLGDQSPAAGMSNAMLAYLAYEKGDITQAHTHLDKGLRFMSNQGALDAIHFAYLTQSWLAADNGNHELANTVLLEGEQVGITYQLPRLTTQLAMRRALRLIHQGDNITADALMQSRQLLDYPADHLSTVREQCSQFLKANIALTQGKFRDAVDLIKPLSMAAGLAGNHRMKAEYDFVHIIALHNAGELNAAGRKFHELLALAAIQERHRFMLQFGALGRGLIAAQYQSRQQSWDQDVALDSSDRLLKILANDLGLVDKQVESEDETSLAEGLTKREIDILRRASRTGLNNKKLAEAIFVSEGTIKWHLHNIYRKLEVRNRAGAIAQAQRLGLLD